MQYYAFIMQQDSAQLSQKLATYMREHRYTQAYVADKAEVDQATVSRFLKKPPQRVTLANLRLCTYAESLPSARIALNADRTAAQTALEICWNRSGAHAQAVSKILDALAELSQREKDEEVASG